MTLVNPTGLQKQRLSPHIPELRIGRHGALVSSEAWRFGGGELLAEGFSAQYTEGQILFGAGGPREEGGGTPGGGAGAGAAAWGPRDPGARVVGALQEPESPLRAIETLESSEPLGNSGPQDF